MQNHLQTKLAGYTSLAAAVLAAQQVNAQIIYSNPPDTTLIGVGAHYHIDLNGDGVADLKIKIENTGTGTLGYGVVLMPEKDFYPGFVQAFDYDDCQGNFFYGYGVVPFNKNKIIKRNESIVYGAWYPVSYGEVLNWDYYGATCHRWAGLNKKFVGLRMRSKEGGFNYAWLRLSVSELGDTVTVYDWAINSKPGQPIMAGQTTSADRDLILSGDVNIYSFGKQIFIKQENQPTDLKISVLNVLGEELKQFTTSDFETQLDMNAFSDGIYIVKVYAEGKIYSKQVVIQ